MVLFLIESSEFHSVVFPLCWPRMLGFLLRLWPQGPYQVLRATPAVTSAALLGFWLDAGKVEKSSGLPPAATGRLGLSFGHYFLADGPARGLSHPDPCSSRALCGVGVLLHLP